MHHYLKQTFSNVNLILISNQLDEIWRSHQNHFFKKRKDFPYGRSSLEFHAWQSRVVVSVSSFSVSCPCGSVFVFIFSISMFLIQQLPTPLFFFFLLVNLEPCCFTISTRTWRKRIPVSKKKQENETKDVTVAMSNDSPSKTNAPEELWERLSSWE